MTIAEHYARIRAEHPTVSATIALGWARTESETDELQARADWEHWPNGVASFTVDGAVISAYEDDEPYDWGDIEPTEQERSDLEVIGVGVRLAGDESDLDSVWGVGFLDGDWQRMALSCVVQYGYLRTAARERQQREDWAARDTVTVDA